MAHFSLAEKKVLVTGSSSGIGAAVAKRCAEAGASVVLNGRNAKRLTGVSEAIGTDSLAIVADLAKKEGIQMLIEALPKLDGIVLNAGMMKLGPIKMLSEDLITQMMQANLMAQINLVRELFKHKKVNAHASFVAISSINGGVVASPANSLYGATKAGLAAFFKGMALDWAYKGIRFNSVAPAMIETEGVQAVLDAAGADSIALDKLKYPMRRYGTPQEVAAAVQFLLSPDSSFITGVTLPIDGGFTAQ